MKIPPLVSVVLVTHNGAAFIRQALASVLSQTYQPLELIIIDDASTDRTEHIVRSQKIDFVRYLKLKKRHGLTRGLNIGLQHAQGTYIARLDDDDVWVDPQKVTKQVAFLEEHREYGLCGTQYLLINEHGKELVRLQHPQHDRDIRNTLLASNPFAHSGVCFRKSLVSQLGGYDETLVYAQDYEYWLRIGTKYKIANLPDHAVAMRVHTKSIGARYQRMQYLSFLKSAWRYRHLYPNFFRTVPHYVRELLINFLITRRAQRTLSQWRRRVFA